MTYVCEVFRSSSTMHFAWLSGAVDTVVPWLLDRCYCLDITEVYKNNKTVIPESEAIGIRCYLNSEFGLLHLRENGFNKFNTPAMKLLYKKLGYNLRR